MRCSLYRKEYGTFKEREKAREAGAEKARGSVVPEETRKLGRERPCRDLWAMYTISIFIARALSDWTVLKQENGIFFLRILFI